MNYYEFYIYYCIPIFKDKIKEARKEGNNTFLIKIRKNIYLNKRLTDKQRSIILQKLNLIRYEYLGLGENKT